MRNQKQLLPLFVSLLSLMVATAAAQAPAEQSKAGTPSATSPPSTQNAAAPAAPAAPQAAQAPAIPAPAAASLNAKDLQGLDVFASGGQQLGKVTKVDTQPDGKVKDVQLQSGGFLGMFKKTYVVPAEKIAKKGSRIELSMTSDQAKQFVK